VLRDPAAKRYAQAAFEVALAHNELDTWERELAGLRDALASNEAAAFLSNRKVPAQAKEEFLRRIAGDPQERVWNLVRLLSSKSRLELLAQIAVEFQAMLDDHRGIAYADVVTAVSMSDEEQRAMVARLSEITGKQVRLRTFEDPDILGGLIAKVGDRLIDGSTRSKLAALKRRLAGATR
jgi:F-type H+-transporting ATPase subunit delta